MGDKIKNNEMGGACGTHVEGCGVYGVLVGKLSDIYHLEDLGIDGCIVLKWVFKMYDMGVDWIYLVQETNVPDASWTRSTAFSHLTS